jgi:hypothetical protein
MSLPATVADRLGLLIPRLASEHDGEVVATARAIRRTLASEQLDLHDLVRSLVPPPIAWADNGPVQPGPRWGSWEGLRPNEKIIALDAIQGLRLSPWEREFAASVAETLRGNPYAQLTKKEQAVLDRLLGRASGGAR